MSMTLAERLQALGFDKNEAAVYIAALSSGEVTIGKLQQQTGLHKQLIYTAADRLQAQGLLTISEVRGRRHFTAADPSLLEQRVETSLGAVRGLLPALYAVASTKKEKDLVRTYYGLAAVRQYYQQSMRTQPDEHPVLVTGTGGQRFFELWAEASAAFQRFEVIRKEKNIPLKLVFFTNGNETIDIPGIKNRKDTSVRMINDSNQAPLDVVVWHTHITLLIYSDEPHVIDIAGEQIVTAFRAYFELAWKQGKKIV